MTQDFAKKKRKSVAAKQGNKTTRKKQAPPPRTWAWFFSGLLCGIFLCFLGWLAAQQPDARPDLSEQGTAGDTVEQDESEKLDFTFYARLPEQNVTVDVDPADVARARKSESMDQYLLQAGSFRQEKDAQRRRAELLLLDLSPTVQKTDGKNGRWYRVYIGPFETRSKLNKARSLTAQQGIETLMLKRPAG
jgi:cell division protein FtsN